MHVRFLDLSIKDKAQRARLLSAIDKVFMHGQFILGPEVEELEQSVADFCGVRYAVGVNSGTDALYIALRALDVGPGDEVITTCLSWIATANAIALTGACPVFVDVENDFNIDAGKIESAITPKTKAIVPVHFTGKMCDMDTILSLAEKHGVKVVEDAAQAFGALYKGRMSGSFGDLAAFSLNPMKIFGACGEAGIILTNDQELYDKAQIFRYNGTVGKVEAHYISLNGRIDTLEAALLLERLKEVPDRIERRREAAAYYDSKLSHFVQVPKRTDERKDVYFTYNTLCEDRDALQSFLLEKGIETKVHHLLLMPEHKAYSGRHNGNWPVGRELSQQSLCLPLHENITREEQDYVVSCISTFYDQRK